MIRTQGGCPLTAHAPKHSEPTQAFPAALPSQSSASTWGIGHVFIPTAQPDPSTPIDGTGLCDKCVRWLWAALAADADDHTDRPGDADDEWGQTWSARGGELDGS
jgi:hypothetical protein